ncbi:TraB/GumN family protein [Pedobacter boryungensis]|uniref:TraB/GumN family protein n=1 Tax=Pedobacter boryungensis TaxID=869962 RepID=A0ABX2DEZ4_9SPHI|nr:TraB/GumN family protein [Pedobacter boryungensis]NQX31851.1 TraB/GumN family protein [Pedobacter boryungensis]
MSVIKYFFICFLSISLNVHAQTKKAENTLLWEISGKDLKKPSYLFGTYHLIGKDFVDTMKVVNEKLKSVDAVVGEIVMNDSVAIKLSNYFTMKGNTLDHLLSKDEYKKVEDFFKEKMPNFNLKGLNNYKPVMISMFITLFNASEKGLPEKGLDDSFQIFAKENNKKIIGLETAEFQGELLFNTDLEKQKKALLKAIKENDKNKLKVKELYQYYIAQDMEKLNEFFKEEDEDSKEFMTDLLKNRNNRWLDKLPQLMRANSLFIAVGAGHLLGDEGLIKGLQNLGYDVKPIATN